VKYSEKHYYIKFKWYNHDGIVFEFTAVANHWLFEYDGKIER